MSDQKRLLALLIEKSYENREVILSSGKKSNFYIDVKQTALNAEGMNLLGNLLFEKVMSGEKVEAIGGITMGADPLACAVSMWSIFQKKPLHAFFIRKEPKSHGTAQWIEGMKNLKSKMPVAILEDVVTTGASTLRAIERAKQAGLVVKRVIAVVDRQEGGKETIEKEGYKLESLFKKEDFI